MAQPLSRVQVNTLVSTAINTLFDVRGKKVKQSLKGILRDETPSTAVRITSKVGFFDELAKKPEFEPSPLKEIALDSYRTTVPESYGAGIVISREAMDDLGKEMFGPQGKSQLASLAKLGGKFRDAAAHTQEVLNAQPFLLANSATATAKWIGAGRDAKALAASDHPLLVTGGTYSNLGATASLSQTALFNLRKSIQTIPSDEGIYRGMPDSFTLVIGPENEDNAHVAIATKMLQGSANNDRSVIENVKFDVVVSPYITGTEYTLLDTSEDGHSLFYIEPQKPIIEEDYDTNTKSYLYTVFFRYRVDFDDPHGLMFSPGA
jgi:hypothetical protein